MRDANVHLASDSLRQARAAILPLMAVIALFSAAVNVLMLTGPVFMLQIYDRVLTSRSVETLVALFALVTFLFVMMGIMDLARNRLLQRAALRFQDALSPQVFEAGLSSRSDGLRDLEAVRRAMASPALPALFDLPWTPLFLGLIFLFHPMLGWLAALGGVALVVAALLSQLATRAPLSQAAPHARAAARTAALFRREAARIRALGMVASGFVTWQGHRARADHATLVAAERGVAFSVFTRSFRLFLQSLMLAAGAFLVLGGELGAGAMIVASILMGRALAPVEQIVAQWPVLLAAREGWTQTARLLAHHPQPAPRTELPAPVARIEALGLGLHADRAGPPILQGIGLRVGPGQVLGITGPTGAGKSTLALALTGALPLSAGQIRLGDAPINHYPAEALARHIGFLPQKVQLFDGGIGQNIARLSPAASSRQIIQAAQMAGADPMINALQNGYDTRIEGDAPGLSGGQIQRIGLARACFGHPRILILDEPDSHLDQTGQAHLIQMIDKITLRGGAVIMVAHGAALLARCDLILRIERGRAVSFGPNRAKERALSR
ncbi:MAG: type I secretion system permease/ATPase [Paracoccus sp. (in: a-proteobacteria)]|nr:type I secretion system permease/ATPase [Paracoccus sp. (in: a-proteobacteria)]